MGETPLCDGVYLIRVQHTHLCQYSFGGIGVGEYALGLDGPTDGVLYVSASSVDDLYRDVSSVDFDDPDMGRKAPSVNLTSQTEESTVCLLCERHTDDLGWWMEFVPVAHTTGDKIVCNACLDEFASALEGVWEHGDALLADAL